MRILFVTGEFPPMQGGVGDYTWSLGSALHRRGLDIHVLTGQEAGPAHLIPSGIDNVYPDIEHWRWGLAGQIRQVAADVQPDVLHIQYQSAAFDLHPAINLLPRALRGAKSPKAVAVTFHDLRTPYLFPKAGPLRWQAVRKLAEWSDAVVVTNAEDRTRLQNLTSVTARLHQVPIGANIQPSPPAGYQRAAQRARWGVGADDLLLCYFGFLNESKGGEELMLALSRLASFGMPAHLLMIGGQVGASDPTNYAYLQHVQQLLEDQGLSDRVHWTGFIPADEVSACLLASDIAVLPYRDGASFRRGSMLAAIAHGVPTLSTDPAVVVPEFVHGENVWLTPPRSPELLADAIDYLWQNNDVRQRLSLGALQLAGRFTWDAIADRHIEIYRALA